MAPTLARPDELALAPLTALFAVKEALFKALAPRVGRYFDFLDAAAVTPASLRLLVDLSAEFPAGTTFDAHHAAVGDEWMVAVVHLAC